MELTSSSENEEVTELNEEAEDEEEEIHEILFVANYSLFGKYFLLKKQFLNT